MAEDDYSARNEALRALTQHYRHCKDDYQKVMCLSAVAQIELLSNILRRLDRLPIPIVPNQ